MKQIVLYSLTITILTSCSTLENSAFLGGGIGTGVGIYASMMGKYDDRSTAIITASTALTGAVIAYITHKTKESEHTKQQPTLTTQPPADQTTTNTETTLPSLSGPKVRKLWIPDKIEGDKFVKGHWVYVIDKQSQWRKE